MPRDEFSQEVKLTLAHRVGLRCSFQECRQLTAGPTDDPARRMNVGVASHITAAAEGGPRFNPSLTPEQRKSAQNGIWLCQIHGKMVDNDEEHYTEAMLRSWKAAAEALALKEIETLARPTFPTEVAISPLQLQVFAGYFRRFMVDNRRECIGPQFIAQIKNTREEEAKGIKLVAEVVQSPSDASDVGVRAYGPYWHTPYPGDKGPKISVKAKAEHTLGYEETWQVAWFELRLVRPFVRELVLRMSWGCEGKRHQKIEIVSTPEDIEALYKTAEQMERGEKFIGGKAGFVSLFRESAAGLLVLEQEYRP